MHIILYTLSDMTVAPLFGGFFIFIIVGAILATLFWLWMLIVILTNETGTDRIIWFLVVFFLHLLGAILYFFICKTPRRAQT